MRKQTALRIILALFVCIAAITVAKSVEQPAPSRPAAKEELGAGNFKDAYEKFSRLLFDPNGDAERVDEDLADAVTCLHRLGRIDEADALREKAVDTQKANWQLLWTAAK